MSSSLDKLKALTSRLEEELSQKDVLPAVDKKPQSQKKTTPASVAVKEQRPAEKSANFEQVREDNIQRVKNLYEKLKIFEKSPDFDDIFHYKAMNLSGIGLKEEDFGEVREGKYIQIIAITYEPDKNGKKKAKNVSLGYFGKAETLDPTLKNEIIEFVLRWRYEKAFQNVEHYKDLIARIGAPKETLF
ncbi:hypothetical protein YH65_05760 [Sulfurovum lithotrophicum]|uniref:Uncharacterized protein n=1 Tax=Sulfurovum lithotrophicum TaxID=206403 RepID=A0A7U4M165_9BACT|nr:hypothetical protein [Sulfurovum lithotrophicum]AKF24950.1 hypothetical protein YH65_05760 [Sulfurovum lithotrophicum]